MQASAPIPAPALVPGETYRALSAREAQAAKYGDRAYWDMLERTATEHAGKGIADAYTRSLADCLRGNDGD